MVVHKYLFFLDNDEITVLNFNPENSGKRFKYETKQGERVFDVDNNFWDWWKTAVSFSEKDEVDFCFIYDKSYSILDNDVLCSLKAVEKSCWTRNIVEAFFREKVKHLNYKLVSADSFESCANDDKCKVFYTNIELEPIVETDDLDDAWETDCFDFEQEREISDFARYWRERISEDNSRGVNNISNK